MIRKLVRQMLTAQVFSALTVSLCLLIDSIMIGRFLKEDGIAAYGLANPLLLAIGAIGSLLAAGIQVTCSRSLGKGSQEETNEGYSSAIVIAGGISLAFTLVALVLCGPLARVMGAGSDGTLYDYTKGYIAGFSIGAPGSMGALVLIPFLQMAGQSRLLIAAVLTMTVADIGLDLLNVLVFHGGMFGMGLASALSYYAAIGVTMIYFCSRDCVFRLSFRKVTRSKLTELFTSGIPAGFSMAAAVVLVFLVNQILMGLGADAGKAGVAAYSVISTIGNSAQCINTGTGGVSLTLAGILYNEEDRTGLRDLLKVLFRYAVWMGLAMGAVLMIFAETFVSLFIVDNEETMRMAATGLRIYAACLIPCCLSAALKNAYQATERVFVTVGMALSGGAFLPALAAFVCSRIWGLTGVWLHPAIGEILTLALLAVFLRTTLKGKLDWRRPDTWVMLREDFGAAEQELMEADIHTLEEVTAVAEKAEAFCRERSSDSRLSNHIALCIEEMAANTIQHGFDRDGKKHNLSVRLLHKKDHWIIRFRDDCRAFDPVHYIPKEGEDAVGIRLVMALAEEARYTYSMNLNNLYLKIRC